MKFSKFVHEEKKCMEYVTGYMGHEASDSPENRVYELGAMSPDGSSDHLIVYVDNIRRYENTEREAKDYEILNKRTIKFNYPIKKESNVKLIVTKKTS